MQTFEAMLVRPDAPGTWTYLVIPFDVEAVYDTQKRVAVQGTIDGHSFRSSLMPQGEGTYILVVNQTVRDAIGKTAGDTVAVTVARDTAPRAVEVPEDLQTALAERQDLKDAFQGFAYSHQKEFVDWIVSAKRPETRSKRIQQAIDMIAERRRPKG